MNEIKQTLGDYKPFTEMNDFESEEQGWENAHDCHGLTFHKKVAVKGDGIPRKCTKELMATCYYARSAQNIGGHCDYWGITGISKSSLGVKSDACTLYVKADSKAPWDFNKCKTDGEKVGRKCGNC